MRMSQIPVGTILRAINDDLADEPMDHLILADDLVLVMRQAGNKHIGNTTMLSLTTGVIYRAEYTTDCQYEAMDHTYEVFEL